MGTYYGKTVVLRSTQKSDILDKITKAGGVDVHNLGRLDISKYSIISSEITTDAVVITEERIEHIRERHPGDWEAYGHFLFDTIIEPDYILADKNPDTAICIKKVYVNSEIKHLRTTLRLHSIFDEEGRENSILTFQKINKKEYGRLSRNQNVIYKKE